MRDTFRSCVELVALSWRQHPLKLAVAVLLLLAEAAAMPLLGLALKELTDAAVQRDAASATRAAVIAAALTIAGLTLGHFAHIAYFELSERNLLTFDLELIDLTNGSARLEHHERTEYADKIGVLRREIQRVGWGGLMFVLSTLSLSVGMVITGALLALLQPILLLLPLAALPPLLAGRRAERILDAARDATAEDTRAARHLFELATTAGPAKELRLFQLQAELQGRHDRLWHSVTDRQWRAQRHATALRAVGQLAFAAGYVAAVLLVVRDAIAGRSTVGDVVLAITLAVQVNQQVTQAVSLLDQLQRLANALTRLRWLRRVVREQAPEPADMPLPDRIRDGITLHDVSFRYPDTDREVLSGVNLHLPAGATVAIVGENGAGKTTLVKLLCRFYEATTGSITLDGVDLNRFDLGEWRQRIAAGFQDFARFEFLARETVGVGEVSHMHDDATVMAALHRAHASEVVDRLPDGLESQLGKSHADGAELSGGQWQKLALGRAMMRTEPLLLVLDEPTSALDAEAEHQLFERYAENARRVAKRTGGITVLVSHRFSTVRMADLILVVAGGRVTAAGDHEHLMGSGGLYADLYTLQAASYR